MEKKKLLTHGGDWAGYQAEYGCQPLDFSANISPLGLPEGIQKAITEAIPMADRYPDPLCRELTAAIAEKENVSETCCLCGNGAADLIFRVASAVKPKKALLTVPCFAEYEQALDTVGCQTEHYVLQSEWDFRLNEDFLEYITKDTDMVFLCEPNNPTGVTTDRKFLLEILEKCREVGAILVLDECFNDFLDEPQEHTLKMELAKYPNLLILKAFTKMYAMAGVRLGYCLCDDEKLLEDMRRAGQPWAVSSLAQAAGLAALKEDAYVERVRNLIQKERFWLKEELRGFGLRVIDGEANYILFQCKKELVQPMREKGILLRSCGNYKGLDDTWMRIAVRTHAENERLILAMEEVLA